MVSALYLILETVKANHGKPTLYLDIVANGHKFFFNPTDTIRVANSPRIGEGPGLETQAGKAYFNKYCFPNLH